MHVLTVTLVICATLVSATFAVPPEVVNVTLYTQYNKAHKIENITKYSAT